jgi:hypothetical protein
MIVSISWASSSVRRIINASAIAGTAALRSVISALA